MFNPNLFNLLLFILNIVKGEWKYIALVEYQAIDNPYLKAEEILNRNADEYIKILDEVSKSHNLIIILFPEATLDNVKQKEDFRSYGVEIEPFQEPCTTHKKKYPTYFQKLSCAAKKYNTTIVFNLIQYEEYKFYSSDVVLDPKGVIQFNIPRERRIGLRDLKSKPKAFAIPARRVFYHSKNTLPYRFAFTPTSFVTGFLFSAEKALHIQENRNYLICSNWISQLPFLTSLQVYQMWGQEFGVSIFFASANNPKRGQGGTGIYHATGGPLLMNIVPTRGTKVYVYNFSTNEPGTITKPLPEKSTDELAKEMDNFYLEADPDLHRTQICFIQE